MCEHTPRGSIGDPRPYHSAPLRWHTCGRTWADFGRSKSATLVDPGAISAEFRPNRANFGCFRAKFADAGPMLVEVVRVRQNLVDPGPNLVDAGPNRSKSAGPNSTDIQPNWPSLVERFRKVDTASPKTTGSGPTSADISPDSVKVRRVRQGLARFGQARASIPRCCAALAPGRYLSNIA